MLYKALSVLFYVATFIWLVVTLVNFSFLNLLATVLYFLFARFLWKYTPPKVSEKIIHQDDEVTATIEPAASPTYDSGYAFPERDEKGMKLLKILDNVRLTGVTKKFDGIDPQETIESLFEGDEVFFKRIHMNKYPFATLVVDSEDSPIGWVPEDFTYQSDIAKRLDEGTTVLGEVCYILGGPDEENPKKSYGISINIARYEKRRVSKKKLLQEDSDELR